MSGSVQSGNFADQLGVNEKYEIFAQIMRQNATEREVADKFGVDGATVSGIYQTARQGALDALSGHTGALQTSLDEARAQIQQLRALSGSTLVEFDGLQFYASTAIEARFLYDEIFRDGCYDIPLPQRPFVVDAGANIGMFTVFVKTKYPDAQVLAFEPMPISQARLRQNIELHNLSGVTVHPLALGRAHEENATFTFYPMVPGNSTRFPETKEKAKANMSQALSKDVVDQMYNGTEVPVTVEPLSAFLPVDRPVDLLKVDVEGAEVDVLLGIEAHQWPLIRNVVMEVPDLDNRLAAVCEILSANGFEPKAEPAPMASRGTEAYLVHASRR